MLWNELIIPYQVVASKHGPDQKWLRCEFVATHRQWLRTGPGRKTTACGRTCSNPAEINATEDHQAHNGPPVSEHRARSPLSLLSHGALRAGWIKTEERPLWVIMKPAFQQLLAKSMQQNLWVFHRIYQCFHDSPTSPDTKDYFWRIRITR